MTSSPSDHPGSPPGERELERLLGRASSLWVRLHADLSSEFGSLAEKWAGGRDGGSCGLGSLD